MKLFHALLICVILSGCSVLAPPPTATPTNVPTSTATHTPKPNLTATARANSAATQTKAIDNTRATMTEHAIPTVTAAAHAADILTQIMAAAAESGDVDVDLSQAKRVFGPAKHSLM